MTRIYLSLLALSLVALTACDNAARSYPTCPPGVSPDEFDCIPPTTVGDDAGTIDIGVGEPDTITEPDTTTPDLGVCIPDCSGRECGGDGCGGVCGTCDGGEACSGGVCVERGGGGDWACDEIVFCVQECPDQNCWQECISQGSPEGQDEFTAIIDCLQEECADVQDDPREYERCQSEQCGDVLNECFGGGGPGPGPGGDGDLECSEALECMFGCDSDECQQECFFEGTLEAQDAMQFLFSCPGLEECGGTGSIDGWLECVSDSCPEEYGACFGGEPIEPTEGCSGREFGRLEEAGEEFGFILVDCGFSCSENDQDIECASECAGSAFGLGESCSECVGEFAICIAEDCGEVCADPNSRDCEECSDRFCVGPFLSCAEG